VTETIRAAARAFLDAWGFDHDAMGTAAEHDAAHALDAALCAPQPVSDPSETRQALQLIVDFHEQCFVRGVPLPVDTTKLQEAYSLAKRLLSEKER
jgi:hypothetical protein